MNMPNTTLSIPELLSQLADPLRLRMLALLESEEVSVGELARITQIPQSTASRHLKVLADGRWIHRRIVGTATYYRLSFDDLEPAMRELWRTIQRSMPESAELAEDARRLASVIAERRNDSLGFFGRLAGEWDELRSSLFGSTFTADALLAMLPERWTVADLGCGTGNGSERIAPYVEGVIAVDQSKPMLEAARKRLTGQSNVEFRMGSLESLPIEDGSVDAAMLILVLHHLDDPTEALRECARVLRTERGGGVALVVDMVEHERDDYRERLGHRHLGFSEHLIEGQMRSAGFGPARVRTLHSDSHGKGPSLFVATARVLDATGGA